MKRSLFIIVGVVIVFILLAVWMYMLFFGSPENKGGMFADFGFGDTSDPTYVEPEATEEATPTIETQSPTSPLQQLTTKPVAGYREISTGSTTPNEVFYAEVGTGHIFAINLGTGQEERISATTIPSNQEAVFTPNGEYVMVRSGSGVTASHQVGTLNREEGQSEFVELSDRVESFAATENNRFMYTVPNGASLTVKEYDPATNLSSTLFTIPFREAVIIWGETVSGPHYIYPKASGKLEGYLYSVQNGSLSRMPIDGFGLSVSTNAEYFVFSKQTEQMYQSYLYSREDGVTSNLARPVLPEKCAVAEIMDSLIVCASTDGNYTLEMPDQWYRGEFPSTDSLYFIDAYRPGNMRLIVNTRMESGRDIDVVEMQFHDNEEGVFFLNRIDRTLWTQNEIY